MNWIKTLSILFALVITACTDPKALEESTEEERLPDRGAEVCHRFSDAEARAYAPTKLFMAIYCDDGAAFFEEFSKDSFKFDLKNTAENNTALAVAIKLERDSMINVLTAHATYLDLSVTNEDGKSFVSLFSEYDLIEKLQDFVDRFEDRSGNFTNDVLFNFSVIDFPDEFNRNAVHYAKSRVVVDKLFSSWTRSALNFAKGNPWNNFFYLDDLEGNIFLHSAAKDQRIQPIVWYVENYCEPSEQKDEEGNIAFWWRNAQNTFSDGVALSKVINIKNDIGDTPLHLAAKLGNSESVRYLLTCDQIDPSILNDEDRNPIMELVKSIDPFQENVRQNYKDSFNLLLDRVDPIWWNQFVGGSGTFKDMITDGDVDGNSALHYIARMADPYFRNALPEFAKEILYNDFGISPGELRQQ